MNEPSHNMTIPSTIAEVYGERARRLAWLRAEPERMRLIKAHYRAHPIDFINDWGVTVDPRNAERKAPTVIPFTLFPIQRQFLQFTLDRWRASENGIIEKSRDMGATWLSMSLSCTLCLFNPGVAIGFGSRKEEYVDKSGDPKSIFWKGRAFMNYLPREFRGGWELKKHSQHMLMHFPETESSIGGEAGDNIGRGGRTSIYFVDEAAFLERPMLVEASLSANTNCRIDMSSVNGSNNPFAEKAHAGKVPKFTMHWRSDPRKDDAWYAKKCAELDPVVVASEIDMNYSASVEGVIIPSQWANMAVNAHEKLGIKPTGERYSTLDIADRGVDKCAWGYKHGILLKHCESWSGKDSDTFATVQQAFGLCDMNGLTEMGYDGDGMGALVRGDARKLNEEREAARLPRQGSRLINITEFRGSGAVLWPESKVLGADGTPLDRTNEDMFYNYKAQSWWALRYRFQQTFRALNGLAYDPDDIISIDSSIPELPRLLMELSQPIYKLNTTGKILVDKLPDGALSPNLADQVMMCYAPRQRAIKIDDSLLAMA